MTASRPSADLTIPDAALDAFYGALKAEPGQNVDADLVRAAARPVVAQFLRDLATRHDRVSGGLLGELADQLDGGGSDE